jgi:DNA-binding MarR family transcriptional regulator
MTNMVKRLEGEGLVGRRPDPTDGRGTIVGLTPAGRELIDAAVSEVAETERALVGGLTEPDRDALAGGLSALLLLADRPARFPRPAGEG